jgi:hypothetical protein
VTVFLEKIRKAKEIKRMEIGKEKNQIILVCS